MQSKECFDKQVKTNLKKRNCKYNTIYPEYVKRQKQTNLDRYGVENVFQNEDIIEKSKQTKISKYGSVHLTHHYIYEDIYFDSTWEIAFWIYHRDMKHKIIHEPCYFHYGKNNIYFPDFKVGTRYYEIKGEQFIKRDKSGKIKCLTTSCGKITANSKAKYKCILDHNVIIIDQYKIIKYLNYVKENYNLDYSEYKINTNKYK